MVLIKKSDIKKTTFAPFLMKISALIFLTLLSSMVAFGQKSTDLKRPIKKDNLVIDLTYDGLINHPNGVSFYFGYGASFQGMIDLPLNSKVMNGAFGVAFSNSNYYNNGYPFHKDTSGNDYTQFYPIPSDSSYKRSKFITNYLDFPFELRFRSTPNSKGHSWKVSAGFRVGVKLGSRNKVITSDNKFVNYDQPNVIRTRYGITGRVGYGRVGLVGYYSLTTLFTPEKGHEMIPFSLGMTISPF